MRDAGSPTSMLRHAMKLRRHMVLPCPGVIVRGASWPEYLEKISIIRLPDPYILDTWTRCRY
jgi:hypothetical protein